MASMLGPNPEAARSGSMWLHSSGHRDDGLASVPTRGVRGGTRKAAKPSMPVRHVTCTFASYPVLVLVPNSVHAEALSVRPGRCRRAAAAFRATGRVESSAWCGVDDC